MPNQRLFTMRTLNFSCATLTILLALTGCGGTSTPATQKPAQSETCSLNWAWSNPVGQSGNELRPFADVTWDNQSCTITTASEASMTVCIQHPAPAELSLQLTRPDQISVPLPALAQAQKTGTCRDGMPFTYPLTAAYLPSNQFNGRWSLRVTDTSPSNNQSGFLIGWSLVLLGRP